MIDKKEAFHVLSKLVAQKYSNFSVVTDFHYLEPGSSEAAAAVSTILLPLLNTAHSVRVFEYRSLETLHPADVLPSWVTFLQGVIEVDNQGHYLPTKESLHERLIPMWLEPGVYLREAASQRRRYTPVGIFVLEHRVESFPVREISNVATAFSSLDNVFSGELQRARTKIFKRLNDATIATCVSGLNSITTIGTEFAIGALVDRYMTESNLKNEYERHCPRGWRDQIASTKGGSSFEVAEKVFTNLFRAKKV